MCSGRYEEGFNGRADVTAHSVSDEQFLDVMLQCGQIRF
jgi:hypothetical protein